MQRVKSLANTAAPARPAELFVKLTCDVFEILRDLIVITEIVYTNSHTH